MLQKPENLVITVFFGPYFMLFSSAFLILAGLHISLMSQIHENNYKIIKFNMLI